MPNTIIKATATHDLLKLMLEIVKKQKDLNQDRSLMRGLVHLHRNLEILEGECKPSRDRVLVPSSIEALRVANSLKYFLELIDFKKVHPVNINSFVNHLLSYVRFKKEDVTSYSMMHLYTVMFNELNDNANDVYEKYSTLAQIYTIINSKKFELSVLPSNRAVLLNYLTKEICALILEVINKDDISTLMKIFSKDFNPMIRKLLIDNLSIYIRDEFGDTTTLYEFIQRGEHRDPEPKIAILCSSEDEMHKMESITNLLDDIGIQYEVNIISPKLLDEYRSRMLLNEYTFRAKERGLQAIIVGTSLDATLAHLVSDGKLPTYGVPLAINGDNGDYARKMLEEANLVTVGVDQYKTVVNHVMKSLSLYDGEVNQLFEEYKQRNRPKETEEYSQSWALAQFNRTTAQATATESDSKKVIGRNGKVYDDLSSYLSSFARGESSINLNLSSFLDDSDNLNFSSLPVSPISPRKRPS